MSSICCALKIDLPRKAAATRVSPSVRKYAGMIVAVLIRAGSTILNRIWPSDNRAPIPLKSGPIVP